MKYFQEKRKVQKIMYSKLVFFVLFVFSIMSGKALFSVFDKYERSNENLARLQIEYDALKKRQDTLQANIESLSTDEGIEAEIRNKFAVAKKGEEVVVVLHDKNNDNEVVENPAVTMSFWQKIVSYFK